jgi:hypothetical protein
MSKTNTKIGDVFSIEIDSDYKRFFQLVAFDSKQLNSDVIRVFKKKYLSNEILELSKIINDEIDFYVHCITKVGLKKNIWEKVGNILEIGNISSVLFRDTNDYGSKIGEDSIKISQNWFIWHISDTSFIKVGKLEDENQHAYMGLVINPIGIKELLKGNKYPINYPDFK